MGVNQSPGGQLPLNKPQDKVQSEENVEIADNEKTGNNDSPKCPSPMDENESSSGVSLHNVNVNEEFTPQKNDHDY